MTVVDTNVLGIANATSDDQLKCAAACATYLRDLASDGRLALDDAWAIIGEYRTNASSTGAPGPGDAFLRWVLTNYANPDRCDLVAITPHAEREYVEFPNDPDLDRFDHADRKFVAVGLVAETSIAVALDRGWWNFRSALGAAGVRLEFLCERELRATAEGRRR